MTTDRRRTPTRRARTLGLSVAGVLAGSVLAAPLVAAKPDTLFPSMGNSGYQVRAYDVAIDYAPLTNRAIADIETVFIMTGENYVFTSSTLIKQVASATDIHRLHRLLPPIVVEALEEKKRQNHGQIPWQHDDGHKD